MAMMPIEGQPGLFREVDDSGNFVGPVINIRDFREGDKYDTVAIPTGAQAWGSEYIFFQNIQNKRFLDTNLKTPSKLSAGESMVLDRIGLYVRSSTGFSFTVPADFKSIVDNAYYRLDINDILQDEGPAVKFPSGYGLYGQTQETGQGVLSIGVPATASASRLVKKQLLNQNHELRGVLRFDARGWLVSAQGPFLTQAEATAVIQTQTTVVAPAEPENCAVLVTNFLHGLIRSAVTK
jgi:hypothetical protein